MFGSRLLSGRMPSIGAIRLTASEKAGPIFHAARKVLTLLEAYPRVGGSSEVSRERDANTHAVGFTTRYLTHRLCLTKGPDGKSRAVASLTPPDSPDWAPLDSFAPIWVVRAPPEIVDGHNGFFVAKRDPALAKEEPYLLDWLVTLHLFGPGPGSPAMSANQECSRS